MVQSELYEAPRILFEHIKSMYDICTIFSKMAYTETGGDKLLNKVVIFIFFAYKKYSRCFIKFRLNH